MARVAATAAVPDAAREEKIGAMQAAYDDLESNFKEQQDKIRKLQAEKLEDKTKIHSLAKLLTNWPCGCTLEAISLISQLAKEQK